MPDQKWIDPSQAEHVKSLVDNPRESLSVELKDWLDPHSPEGSAKIARAILALRNQNGGFLVIGFDDKTKLPVIPAPWADIPAKFHVDVVQSIVSKYSSHLFEVTVELPEREGQVFPVVQVPAGLTAPAVCKRDLKIGEIFHLREGEIYVRTLAANGIVSSARANWKDWEGLIARCFDNREADHARFFTKMFSGVTQETARKVFTGLATVAEEGENFGLPVQEVLKFGVQRFETAAKGCSPPLPDVGFWDIALRFQGFSPGDLPPKAFLQTLRASNPDLTGWPVWLVSSDFTDNSAHPYLVDNRWEALIYRKSDPWGSLDFMIFDPKGAFFLRRGLQEDFTVSQAQRVPKPPIEPILQILRVAESIAVGLAFARSLKCPEEVVLVFLYQWTKLEGRLLEAWSSPMYPCSGDGPARQDEVTSLVRISVSANDEAVIEGTLTAIRPLARIFGGFEMPEAAVRLHVTRLLTRKL